MVITKEAREYIINLLCQRGHDLLDAIETSELNQDKADFQEEYDKLQDILGEL